MKIPRSDAISYAPFLEEARGYNRFFFKDDLFAALAVALMTIPQSIAYSLLAGLPPTAGLYSAIFGTIFTATFGSSKHLVSGPSTGTAILIQTSIADILYNYYDLIEGKEQEALVLHILTQIVIVIGIVQIVSAFFNVNKLLQFVSRPVVLGYFAGITVAIAVTQIFAFTGVPSPVGDQPLFSKAVFFFSQIVAVKGWTLLLGMICLLFILFMRKRFPNFPNALIMLTGASLAAYFFNLHFGEETIQTLFGYSLTQKPVPEIIFPFVDFSLFNRIFPAAIAISFLGILEVFSLSKTMGSKSGQKIQINQDIFGLGLANTFLAFLVGAMPASGSATRTSLNFRLKAKTRFSAIFSGIIASLVILFFWPLVTHIPLAALAALLIATVHTLMDFREIRLSLRATREDAWVFLLTFFSCLILSLDTAFFIGIIISIGTYLRKTSIPHLVEYAFNPKGRLIIVNPHDEVHRKVRIIGIGGDLYFATAEIFQAALSPVAEDPHVQAIVLRLNNVHHMDASMCLVILHLHHSLKASGRHLIVSGLTDEVWQVFHHAGVAKEIGLDNLYFSDETNPQFSTWKAVLRAQELIHKK